MTLQGLLSSRRGWTDDDTIYVVQPWSCDAEALLASQNPAEHHGAGDPIRSALRLFHQGFIARDFLDDLGASAEDVSKEACERLIRYAIYDA